MRKTFLTSAAAAALLMSAAASAADLEREDIAPGLNFQLSFGGSQATAARTPSLRLNGIALNETEASSTGLSTGVWVAVGVAAVVVVVVVASHHGGGGGGGGGGY